MSRKFYILSSDVLFMSLKCELVVFSELFKLTDHVIEELLQSDSTAEAIKIIQLLELYTREHPKFH